MQENRKIFILKNYINSNVTFLCYSIFLMKPINNNNDLYKNCKNTILCLFLASLKFINCKEAGKSLAKIKTQHLIVNHVHYCLNVWVYIL